MAYQIFFTMFAISIPMVTLVVAGRHLWAMAQSLRAKKFILSFFSLLAVVSMAGLFVAVGAAWFGYGVGCGAIPADVRRDGEQPWLISLQKGFQEPFRWSEGWRAALLKVMPSRVGS